MAPADERDSRTTLGDRSREESKRFSYSRPYGIAFAMERAISLVRKEAEAEERRSVAAEVDRLVRESGLSRSEFASQIGTSASRLSTYATGRVTPSAALMLRMRHLESA
jgi:DNA-binding transcriptional regulator YiaG